MAAGSKLSALGRLVTETILWHGRASRRTFYGSICLLYVLAVLALPITLAELFASATEAWWAWPLRALTVPLAVGACAILLGAFIRRLHDRNKASWWLLVFFGPHAAWAWALTVISPDNQQMLSLAFTGGFFLAAPLLAWGMVEIFILPGVRGQNRFGGDPLALRATGAVAG